MKKLILTSICTLVVSGVALAQGNVNWSGVAFGSYTSQTNSTTYSPLFGGGPTGNGAIGATQGNTAVGTGFYYELLYTGSYNGSTAGVSPTTLTALGTWTDSGLGATNSTTAGRATVLANENNAGATVAGMHPGTTNYIILVGWSADLGTTWATADANMNNATYLAGLSSQAFFGISTVGYITPLSSSTSPGAAVFGAASAQGQPINGSTLTQLYLIPVPEPGTMALAAIGGASLLLFRRRK